MSGVVRLASREMPSSMACDHRLERQRVYQGRYIKWSRKNLYSHSSSATKYHCSAHSSDFALSVYSHIAGIGIEFSWAGGPATQSIMGEYAQQCPQGNDVCTVDCGVPGTCHCIAGAGVQPVGRRITGYPRSSASQRSMRGGR